MSEGLCPGCGKAILIDVEKYLENNPDRKWDQCCYCGIHFPTHIIIKKEEIKRVIK